MPGLSFGVFLAPYHPLGDSPLITYRRDLEIIGSFPKGRYGQSAVMNRDRLNNALDAYKNSTGKPHPLAEKTLEFLQQNAKIEEVPAGTLLKAEGAPAA